MSFIAFWNRFCPANESIKQRYHLSVDSRIAISQNEAMRLSFPIRDLYLAAIDKAEQSIFLTTAYFVPDRMLLEALKAAARRGVDVRVLVPWVSNHVVADWIAHSYFTDCLQGSDEIAGTSFRDESRATVSTLGGKLWRPTSKQSHQNGHHCTSPFSARSGSLPWRPMSGRGSKMWEACGS